ncbi:hypothetical protein [Embleya sp. NBC_00896]|uniref:hypothetical protein n=1 Tax=Embleya sp. NBC_00896 TaxID=2975961 RepID=UPI002F914EAF|nr:hypothetical protein OG928_45045 [Embleya sp. NBC_00896]
MHTSILTTGIDGDTTRMYDRLDRRHGPGAFAALFLSPGSLAADTPDRTGFTLAGGQGA